MHGRLFNLFTQEITSKENKMKRTKVKSDYLAAYCRNCKKKQPIQMDVMLPPKKLKKVLKELKIISCGVCEKVLNLEKDIKVVPVTEEWMNKRGWVKRKKKASRSSKSN
jgi:hypothetical protein